MSAHLCVEQRGGCHSQKTHEESYNWVGANLPSTALEMPHLPSWKVCMWEQNRKEGEYLKGC